MHNISSQIAFELWKTIGRKENCPNFAWIFCSKKDTGKMHNKSSQIAFELWKTIGNEPQNDLKMHRKMATNTTTFRWQEFFNNCIV